MIVVTEVGVDAPGEEVRFVAGERKRRGNPEPEREDQRRGVK